MGVAITPISSDSPQQPNVLYESGAKILTPNADGKIFKMVFTTGADPNYNLNYAESNDGKSWTRYGANPVLAQHWGSRVFKRDGTYYLYCSSKVFTTNIQVYTSTDLISWTLQNASAITTSASGWDSVALGQFNVLTIDSNGVWWGYFWAINLLNFSTIRYNAGLATSLDGINWTKGLNNPVNSLNNGVLGNGTSWTGSFAGYFANINGQYYCWSQMTQSGYPGAGTALPTDILRWSASNPAGPWTPLSNIAYSRTIVSEGQNSRLGQVADPSLVEVNGSTYIYYSATSDGTASNLYQINVGKAPLTMAQLVQTFEGVVNVPVSGNPTLNLQTLASDNFLRVDANPIGGNWSPLSTTSNFGTAQILSGKAASSAIGKNSDSWWNALPWAPDQWSQAVVSSCSAASFVGINLRNNTANAISAYRVYWTGALGTSGTWAIQSIIAGVGTNLASGSLTLNAGDAMMATVIGTTLCFYLNGILVGIAAGNTDQVSGPPGFLLNPATAVVNAEITSWTGGSFAASPIIIVPPTTPPTSVNQIRAPGIVATQGVFFSNPGVFIAPLTVNTYSARALGPNPGVDVQIGDIIIINPA